MEGQKYVSRKLRSSSLKTKLLVSFVIVLILPSIVIGWTSYQQAKTNFNETISQTAKDNIKILDNVINKELDSKKQMQFILRNYLHNQVTKRIKYKISKINQKNIISYIQNQKPSILDRAMGSLFNHHLFKCQKDIILQKEIGIKRQ